MIKQEQKGTFLKVKNKKVNAKSNTVCTRTTDWYKM